MFFDENTTIAQLSEKIDVTDRAFILSAYDKPDFESRYKLFRMNMGRAVSKWACISAKSQRDKKELFGDRHIVAFNQYQNLTEMSHRIRYRNKMKVPDRSGKLINRFTVRSRQRLMRKCRKMNLSNESLPFFVTLTYHSNFRDFKRSKAQLNVFLQRFRRKCGEFKYIWKMELQKRGAIHFHLALFVDDEFYPIGWGKAAKTRLEYMRLYVSTVWNVINGEGYYNLRYGTNVRDVDTWKMFLGYIYKYMGKEEKNEFVDKETGEIVAQKTGRFWGTSYNFDLEPIHSLVFNFDNMREREAAISLCSIVNHVAFIDFQKYVKREIERKKAVNSPEKFVKIRKKYVQMYERQKRRYIINNEKIKEWKNYSNECHFKSVERLIDLKSLTSIYDIRRLTMS